MKNQASLFLQLVELLENKGRVNVQQSQLAKAFISVSAWQQRLLILWFLKTEILVLEENLHLIPGKAAGRTEKCVVPSQKSLQSSWSDLGSHLIAYDVFLQIHYF